MASAEARTANPMRSSPSCVNPNACAHPKPFFAMDHYFPHRQADMQPLLHSCSDSGSSKLLRQSLSYDWTLSEHLKEKLYQRGEIPNPRVWSSPSPFGSAEYEQFSPSYIHPTYSRVAMLHNGGSGGFLEAANSGSRFPSVLGERGSMFGVNYKDNISLGGSPRIYSRSPAPVSGMCTPSTSLHTDGTSDCGFEVQISRRQDNKQVTLYKWFLIRTSNADPGTIRNVQTMSLCVGGFMRFGSQDSQLVKTSAVAERVEKCRLRTIDGTEIFLVGCIDEKSTIANGFSAWVTHLFLTGFPCNWNHLPEILAITPDGASTMTPRELKDCEAHLFQKQAGFAAPAGSLETNELHINQQKNQVPVSPSILFPEISLNDEEGRSRQNNVGTATCETYTTEARGANVHHLDGNYKEKAAMSSPFANQEEPQCGVSDLPELQRFDNSLVRSTGDTNNQKNNGNGEVLSVTVPNEAIMHVHPGKEDSTTRLSPPVSPLSDGFGPISHHKDQNLTLEAKNLDEEKSSVVDCRSGINPEQVLSAELAIKSFDKGGDHHHIEKQNHVSSVSEIYSDNDLSNGEPRTRNKSHDISHLHCPIQPQRKYFTRSSKKDPESKVEMRSLELTYATQKEPRKAVKVGSRSTTSIKMKSSKQSQMAVRIDKKRSETAGKVDFKSMTSMERESIEKTQSTDHPDLEKPKNAVEVSSITKIASKASMMGVQNREKCQRMTRRGSAELAHSQASEVLDRPQDCGYLKEPVHNAALVEENERSSKAEEAKAHGTKCQLMRSSRISNSQVDEVNSSKRKQSKLGFTTRSQQQKNLRLPPPLPPPRVDFSKDQVVQAYGLKTSRSGRILVPPLAYWRNQTLAHDMDGRIIAIREGFEEPPSDTGRYNFKPPMEKTAVRLQEELLAAYTDLVMSKKSKRRKRNH